MDYYIHPSDKDHDDRENLPHVHIGGVETFSKQDRISNKKFANVAGGIISAIAIPASNRQLKQLIFYILPQGKESLCVSKLDNNNRYVHNFVNK